MYADSSQLTSTAVTELPLTAVTTACQQRTQRQEREGIDYCFELFRRAFDAKDELAWEAIQTQYFRLICSWVQQFQGTNDVEIEEIAWEVVTRFWRTLGSKEMPIGERFVNTSQLMLYLKRCAFSVQQDRQRRNQREREVVEHVTLSQSYEVRHFEERISEQIAQQAEQEKVRQWLAQHVTDPSEQLVLTLTFEQGLAPRQIVANYPAHFPDTRSVRRTKERLLKRARRYWNH